MGFIWYELLTSDAADATRFYTQVVGWTASDATGANAGYTILSADGRGVAGLHTLPQAAKDAGACPGWIGYVLVSDTDAAAARIEAAGGTIRKPPFDIEDVGRAAIVMDPTGATFSILAPLPREGEMPPPAPRMTPGHCGWHELQAGDGEAAFRFYSEQFGWAESSIFDMGAMGPYRLWSPSEGGEAVGGMMTKMPQMPAAAWIFYFAVDGAEAGAARITEAGGTVVNGPMEVPDGSWVVQGLDPQGVMFALVSTTR